MRICVIVFSFIILIAPKLNAYQKFVKQTDTSINLISMLFIPKDSCLAQKIVAFAQKQIGAPYRYCSMTPDGGFDCSGFVNYVFNHFKIWVPRSSVDFTNIGKEIAVNKSQPGDLILFTGTNPHIRSVGHIGIVTQNDNGIISFIQSTSGAAYGVVVSLLDKNYKQRFVKVIRKLE